MFPIPGCGMTVWDVPGRREIHVFRDLPENDPKLQEELFQASHDPRSDQVELEHAQQTRETQVNRILARLDERDLLGPLPIPPRHPLLLARAHRHRSILRARSRFSGDRSAPH